MPHTTAPSRDAQTRHAPRARSRAYRMAGLVAVVLLAGPFSYVALGSSASAPVTARVYVGATLPDSLHVDAEGPSDTEIFRLKLLPGASTVWHSHAGSVLVSVKQGTAAVYDAAGSGCTRRERAAGAAFLESPGQIHAIRNETRGTLVLYAVSIQPMGSDPGISQTPPSNCSYAAASAP